jgi:tricorn protease
MSIQGDIYAYRTDGKVDNKGVTLTDTSDAWETEPVFSEDGKTLFYFKNEGYGNGITKFDILTMTESLLLRADEGMHNLFRIPKTNLLSYVRGTGDIMVLDPADGKQDKIIKTVCFQCGRDYPMTWSPDGKYLAFVDVSDSEAEIKLVNRESKESWNLSHYFGWNWQPVFSPDGRFLSFTEEYNDMAVVKLIELDPKTKLDKTVLVEEEAKPAEEAPKAEEKVAAEKPAEEPAPAVAAPTETKPEEAKPDEAKPAEEEKKIEVKINFENITDRARVVSISSGANFPMGFTFDGEFLFYVNLESYEMWLVPTDPDSKEPPKNLGPSPDMLIYTDDSIYALAQAKVFKYSNAGMGDELKFVVQKNIDQMKEVKLALLLLGRNLKESFYDEKMHGANWDKAIKKYLGMISDARVPEDVAAIMNRLNGELNASHLGAYGPVSESGQPDDTAQLGLEWDPFHTGEGMKVRRVYKDGPADKPDIEIKPGDIVLEIEGTIVDMTHDPSVLLNHKAGEVLTLTVKGDPENRKVKIRSAEYGMLGEMKYKTWVEENRQRVDKLSDNKLGYVHIQEMSGPSLDKFKREYLNLTREKKGVIIDVRYNPGGFIHEQLIDTLNRQTFGFAQPRGLENMVPQPYTYNRTPSIVLINEACTSDAEIFPYAYSALGLGKLVGMETYGCVIGVVPVTLPGGYMMGLPCVGWFRLDTSNLENHGVKPDIEIDNPPDSIIKNRDPQLERAVEELLKEVR